MFFNLIIDKLSTLLKWIFIGRDCLKLQKSPCECVCFYGAHFRCLVTFRFWHARGYENTRRASRWVPAESILPSLCSHHPLLFSFSPLLLHPVFLQVSSHLQVLAKRKSREIQSKLKVHMLTDSALLCMWPKANLTKWSCRFILLCQGVAIHTFEAL